jgi:hypothetical protein
LGEPTSGEPAHLEEANLRGAQLVRVDGLTWAQLEETHLDDKTILPHYLKQERESKKEEIEKDEEGTL